MLVCSLVSKAMPILSSQRLSEGTFQILLDKNSPWQHGLSTIIPPSEPYWLLSRWSLWLKLGKCTFCENESFRHKRNSIGWIIFYKFQFWQKESTIYGFVVSSYDETVSKSHFISISQFRSEQFMHANYPKNMCWTVGICPLCQPQPKLKLKGVTAKMQMANFCFCHISAREHQFFKFLFLSPFIYRQ
jgi:hypothetical protein